MPESHSRLRLLAETPEDLQVISAVLQDALLLSRDVVWQSRRRCLLLRVQRFRWEAPGESSEATGERVAAALRLDGVLGVRSRGIDREMQDQVACLLSMEFNSGEDCSGVVRLNCANGAEIAIEVECLEVRLADLSRPWIAAARPEHDPGA